MNEPSVPHGTLDLASLGRLALDRIGLGMFIVDLDMRVQLWNRFMADHGGVSEEQIKGRVLFDCFPDLPRNWLQKKIATVILLKNFGFSSWEQRPYLFAFAHSRPLAAGIRHMRQDCTFIPLIEDQRVVAICVTVADVTELALLQAEREAALHALNESAMRDSLTGAYNRRYFEARAREVFSAWRRDASDLALLMFDLDHFKRINDDYGHLAGDAVLRTVAQRVQGLLRTTDILGRYGGEEFIVMLPGADGVAAFTIAESIRHALAAEPVVQDGLVLHISASVGVSALRRSVLSLEAAIRDADAALYAAKRAGRDRVVCISDEPGC